MESSRPRASSLSSTSSASTKSGKASRPRLSSPHKRVSFDATSVPLPSATWEELASPATLANPPFPLPILASSTPARDIRKVDIDSSIDLKAILAQGIIEWRNEVEVDGVEEQQ
ncbi:hypothetical protein M407DRAFT_244562 [Tulasnella calospora MUT 4182]|uniref:Uncharacterized protein n=1 Tax=Tulasnella calospora MUT 4182 TaxID=1051891 RepID=A0A0C3LRQ7_9AGAM|nr:hypothetical protein M407DRAFT_244562 [Tulasnella calospora MUT 4182]